MNSHPDILPDAPWMLRACCVRCATIRSHDVLLVSKAVEIESGGIQVTANLTCPEQHQNHFVTSLAQWGRFAVAFPERRKAS